MKATYHVQINHSQGKTHTRTDYLSSNLPRSHDSMPGTGNDTEYTAIDIVKAIKNTRSVSFLQPGDKDSADATHTLQMLASKKTPISAYVSVLKYTLQGPNKTVYVSYAYFDGSIQSIFPIDAGYEVNLGDVKNFKFTTIEFDENEMAALLQMLRDEFLNLLRDLGQTANEKKLKEKKEAEYRIMQEGIKRFARHMGRPPSSPWIPDKDN